MTIVFFARRFYPLIGGVEKHVYELSKRLIQSGHKIIVVTERTDTLPLHEILKPLGIEIYRINAGTENKNKKFRIWKEIWKLRHIIKKADIIHCHDVFFWYLPLRFYFPNKPVYTTFHGYESYPLKKKALIIRKISEALSWGNICIGDFIPKWYMTKPTIVSYGAVDTSSFVSKKPTYKKESAVFIGRLDEQTGIVTYAKATELVQKQLPNFTLQVVGDGNYKDRLGKKIKILGFKNEINTYLQKNHFAFVSRYLTILEAFAAKRLVFAVYDNPVKEDYLKMAPFADFLIVAKTPEELSKKIIYILKHPKEEKIIVDKAFTWVKDQTWEKLVLTYLKLWRM